MPQLTVIVPPSPGPISVLSPKDNDKGILYHARFNSAAYSMEVPGKISFPDPPRPPTPGPPRPPPIPPRPPVPTPPPSPHSSVEKEWLQKLVAENISILAVRVMNVWFAAREPVSFPHPPRPPTPGPRPGPINPPPNVPTPPPSPRRSAKSVDHAVMAKKNYALGTGGLDTILSRQLFYEYLALKLNILYTADTPSYDPYEGKGLNMREAKYEDKLTDDPDRDETRLHTLIYVPKSVSRPHMSHLDSCRENEPETLIQALRASAGIVRHLLNPSNLSGIGESGRTFDDLAVTTHSSPAVSGIYSQPTPSIITAV
ncbi:hypothetical protein F5Y00DRAFT_262486 [Daldinia vernicosa]|uniref:uncharacterized protein n=1 Tax=Daldinia vernicosa TaxID=114800 RepID=UPI002007B6E6|nr:uncharacterized protein F5Y00DRAFT_262486 [Daldinia vernicosa]KAI0848394.1 hypothetical protein F5Y00DRAFT_262486 [Daldinia vernicosa]